MSRPERGSLGDLLARAGLEVADRGPGDPGGPGVEREPTASEAVAGTADIELSGAGKIVLRRERKGRGGRTATVVSGLPREHLDHLARAMRWALGCGATLEGETLVLSGDLADRAREWLAAHGARRLVVGN